MPPLYNNYNSYGYFPQGYQQHVQAQPQQMYSQQSQQGQTQQIQQSGFIPVPSEEVARNYPVAPGNSVSFKNENAPYVYVKTMGYSPLDMPTFEKFRLVKEESVNAQAKESMDMSIYAQKDEVNILKEELEALKESFAKFGDVFKVKNNKREVSADDE